MANADAASGFRPVNRDGSPYNGATLRAVIAAGDGTATFPGDAVKLAGSSINGYPTVIQCAAGDPVYAVVSYFEPVTHESTVYRAASTERYCQVVPVDSTYFEVQEDGVTSQLDADDIGLNANFIVGTGDTTYGRSAMEIDSDSAAGTATLDLQLVAFVDRADNEIGTANSKLIVKFNDPQTKPGRTGA